MRIEQRPATENDIPFLLSLRLATMERHLAASGASLSEDVHRDRVMYHFNCARILTCDGEPVGLLKVRRTPDEWEIVQIQLSEHLQGQGLGRALLEQVIADATAANASLRLSVLKANPARHLYERLGFRLVGEDALEYFLQRPA